MSFPSNFTWGAAAAAYQIEGAVAEDGRAPSIWDAHSHTPGRTFDGHTGDVACDHYHRWPEDVAIMRNLAIKAYRMSISWSRVIPQGTGKPNAKGLAFYDKLFDGLLEAGITPWVTLFHWDLPVALQQRGGFQNRDMVEWFGDYAALIADKYGDRVKHFMTINEPPCVVGLGLQDGVFAPGYKLPYSECLLAAHHPARLSGSSELRHEHPLTLPGGAGRRRESISGHLLLDAAGQFQNVGEVAEHRLGRGNFHSGGNGGDFGSVGDRGHVSVSLPVFCFSFLSDGRT